MDFVTFVSLLERKALFFAKASQLVLSIPMPAFRAVQV